MNLFTSDIDWAPEEVIADTVELFTRYGVKCTFFCTHPSGVIDSISRDSHFELGVHPNFMPLMNEQKGTVHDAIKKVLDLVPDAKGVRSHSLLQSTPLFQVFRDYGFLYEANTNLPYKEDILPYKLWNGLVKVMHNFEDDIHFMYKYDFDDCRLDLESQKLNVFSFHPIHIFLNTDAEHTYNQARPYYQNAKELLRYRNTKRKGTRDLLIELLEQHNRRFNNQSFTVIEYLSNSNYLNGEN